LPYTTLFRSLLVARGIVPETGRHSRPRLRHDQLADGAAHGTAGVVEDLGGHAGDGAREGAGFDRSDGKAAQDSAGDFRSTGVVADRDPRLTGVLEEPAVRLRVPRLAGGAQHAQRREVVSVDVLGAVR